MIDGGLSSPSAEREGGLPCIEEGDAGPSLKISGDALERDRCEPDPAGRRRSSPMYTTEKQWEETIPVAAAARTRGGEVELQEKRSVPKAKRTGDEEDDSELNEEADLLDGIPRYFKASWPNTYERVMHTLRPATDIYFLCALFFVTFFSPPTESPESWLVWNTLNSHRFVLIWVPFWWRFFRSFLHFLISIAIIPGPLLYNEGPLTRFYPKWLLESIKEGNYYRQILRPRLEKAGGISLQLVSADGVAVDAMYFPGQGASIDGPTVVRFNGNAEAFELQDDMLPKIYTHNGLNFILFNYRGVGRSRWVPIPGLSWIMNSDLAGTLCGYWRTPPVNGTAIDAWTVLEFVLVLLRVPPKQVVLLGHSIGGAIATQLAANKHCPPVCLCNSRSFGYLSSVAVHLSPHFLGVQPGTPKARYVRVAARAGLWLAGWEYCSVENWAKASGFKWIEFSGADHIIPYEHSLYQCLTGKQVKRSKDGKEEDAVPLADMAKDDLRVIALIDLEMDNHNRMLHDTELLQHLNMIMEAVGWSPNQDFPI